MHKSVYDREGIFVRSEFMETLMSLGLMDWSSPGFKNFYRNRDQFEKTYIKSALGRTLGRLYNVNQWPRW